MPSVPYRSINHFVRLGWSRLEDGLRPDLPNRRWCSRQQGGHPLCCSLRCRGLSQNSSCLPRPVQSSARLVRLYVRPVWASVASVRLVRPSVHPSARLVRLFVRPQCGRLHDSCGCLCVQCGRSCVLCGRPVTRAAVRASRAVVRASRAAVVRPVRPSTRLSVRPVRLSCVPSVRHMRRRSRRRRAGKGYTRRRRHGEDGRAKKQQGKGQKVVGVRRHKAGPERSTTSGRP